MTANVLTVMNALKEPCCISLSTHRETEEGEFSFKQYQEAIDLVANACLHCLNPTAGHIQQCRMRRNLFHTPLSLRGLCMA